MQNASRLVLRLLQIELNVSVLVSHRTGDNYYVTELGAISDPLKQLVGGRDYKLRIALNRPGRYDSGREVVPWRITAAIPIGEVRSVVYFMKIRRLLVSDADFDPVCLLSRVGRLVTLAKKRSSDLLSRLLYSSRRRNNRCRRRVQHRRAPAKMLPRRMKAVRKDPKKATRWWRNLSMRIRRSSDTKSLRYVN